MAEPKQNASGTLPKNIRQIGDSIGNTRVYLEDYVYTYLHTQNGQEEWDNGGFVLLGRLERNREYARYFISGLIRIKDSFFHEGILEFSDETWAYIYQEMKQYYDELEIVGWGQDVSNAPAGLTAEIERSHAQNFNIQKNVLLLLDRAEKEEAFYIFEKNMLQRREGYYIYYEKNPQMQEYMIGTLKSRELNVPVSMEGMQNAPDRSYREALLEKRAQMAGRKWNGILYATSMMLVLAVCVLGVSTVNNVEKMQHLETAVNQISSIAGQAGLSGSKTVPVMGTDTKQAGKTGEDDSTPDAQDAQKKSGGANADEKKTGNTAAEADDSKKPSEKSDEQARESGGSEQTAVLTQAQTYLLQGYYIVQKGDNLAGISRKIYGTPNKAKKICELNGIEDMDKIYAGQRLELP